MTEHCIAASFRIWQPELYKYYERTMAEMERALTKLYEEHNAEEAMAQEGEAIAPQQHAGIQAAQQNLGQQRAVARRNATRRQQLEQRRTGAATALGMVQFMVPQR